MKAVYSFSAKGVTPDGIKVRCEGEVIHEEGTLPFPPHEVFEKARECVEKQFPGIKFDCDKSISGLPVKGYPTVRKNKTATKTLQKKLGTEKVTNS